MSLYNLEKTEIWLDPFTKNILWARLVVSQTVYVCKSTGKFVKSLGLILEILTSTGLGKGPTKAPHIKLMIHDAHGAPTTVWEELGSCPQKSETQVIGPWVQDSGGGCSQAGGMLKFTWGIRVGFGKSGQGRLGNKSLRV